MLPFVQNSVQIKTLGCKLNYSESSHLMRELQANGFILSDNPEYYIVNTCAVTNAAEKKGRNLIHQLHREYPNAKLIITGCYSALHAREIEQWEGVDKVFGSEDKINLVEYILNKRGGDLEAPYFFSTFSSSDRTRSFLKIQDGCDYHCSYCTVCIARGKSRSDTIANVLENLQKIKELGIKEVNLTGVNLGDFGTGTSENFYQLLQAMEREQLVKRVRISSIEPNLLTDEIIELVAQSKTIMPHFHIPLQSGCDEILALMRRRYNTTLFQQKVTKIKELMPHACIAADVITGFPGESNEYFEKAYQFLENLPISYLHVFTYSIRPGTPAATMKNQVPHQVKKERTHQLLNLSQQKKVQFYQQHLNQQRSVLLEEAKNNVIGGFTDNYIRVEIPWKNALMNNSIQDMIIADDMLVYDETL